MSTYAELQDKFKEAARAMFLTGATECWVRDTAITLVRADRPDAESLLANQDLKAERWEFIEYEKSRGKFLKCIDLPFQP